MKEKNAFAKLERAIVYICHAFKKDPMKLGSVKLNKILWFSDTESLEKYSRTITGLYQYQAQNLGPVLPMLPTVMARLFDKGLVNSQRVDFVDYQQWVYTILDEVDAISFTNSLEAEEKAILDTNIEYARNHTVREVVNKAHDYPWWNNIKIASPLPVNLCMIKE